MNTTKWEYRIVYINVDNDVAMGILNQLGEVGWELVTQITGHFYFKRQVVAKPPEPKKAVPKKAPTKKAVPKKTGGK